MIGMFGAACVLGIAAIGSAIGIGCAGQAAIGAWKRCYMNNKPAPFILTVFAGAPLTQTIYGFLLMQNMINSTKDGLFLLALGIFSGLAMAASAVFQGKAGAAGSMPWVRLERDLPSTSWLSVFVRLLLCLQWYSP